jgi:hypothetical protein
VSRARDHRGAGGQVGAGDHAADRPPLRRDGPQVHPGHRSVLRPRGSVFWRGTLPWPGRKGISVGQLDLGAHAEALRLYLLRDEQNLPEGVVINTFVSNSSEHFGVAQFLRLRGRAEDAGLNVYWFGVPGLSFMMLVGRYLGRCPIALHVSSGRDRRFPWA